MFEYKRGAIYTCVHAMQEVFDLMGQIDHEKVSRSLRARLAVATDGRERAEGEEHAATIGRL